MSFSTMLYTYCLLPLIHPSGLLDFDAPNNGRHHIACSWSHRGGRLGGLPLALEGRHFRPLRVGVAEVRLGSPMRLPEVSATEMAE